MPLFRGDNFRVKGGTNRLPVRLLRVQHTFIHLVSIVAHL
jgi:hypothetical protein